MAEIFAATRTRMPRRALMPESRDLFALFRCCAENDAAAAMTIDADLYQVGAEWGGPLPGRGRRSRHGAPGVSAPVVRGRPDRPLIYAGVGNRDTASSRP